MRSTLTGNRTQSQCEGYKDARENRLNGDRTHLSVFQGYGVNMQNSKRIAQLLWDERDGG